MEVGTAAKDWEHLQGAQKRGCGEHHPLDGSPGEARGGFRPLFTPGWKGLGSTPAPQPCSSEGHVASLTENPLPHEPEPGSERGGGCRNTLKCRGQKPRSNSAPSRSKSTKTLPVPRFPHL